MTRHRFRHFTPVDPLDFSDHHILGRPIHILSGSGHHVVAQNRHGKVDHVLHRAHAPLGLALARATLAFSQCVQNHALQARVVPRVEDVFNVLQPVRRKR
ncbi:hypothetical protein LguiA_009499 [Lonicera macranthoides]